MSDYATLTDTVTSDTITFMMNPDWKPVIHEEGSLWYPFGYGYAVKSTDGTKGVGGILTIASTSDAMDTTVKTLLQSNNLLKLVMPNADVYYLIWDPATDRKGTSLFSLMGWQPVNTWTVYYVEQPPP